MRLPFEPLDPCVPNQVMVPNTPTPRYSATLGALYAGDCLEVFPHISDNSIDMIFADPPFNVGKKYGQAVDDERPDNEYVHWCKTWIDQCARVLKPGGALFLYNLPRWNVLLG